MKQNEIYNELVGLADSLDDHVTDDEIGFKLRELAYEIDGRQTVYADAVQLAKEYTVGSPERVIAALRGRYIVNPEAGPYRLYFSQQEIEAAITAAFKSAAEFESDVQHLAQVVLDHWGKVLTDVYQSVRAVVMDMSDEAVAALPDDARRAVEILRGDD